MTSKTGDATRIAELTEQITRHDRLYHTLDSPEITDAQYDALTRELRELEARNPALAAGSSPVRRVGAEVSADFAQVNHPEPMLSLGNAFSEEDFLAWHRRMTETTGDQHLAISVEMKIDGLAFRIWYDNTSMMLAATRGDGLTGEDVSHTVRTVRDLPMRLHAGAPKTLNARGEIYMRRSAFETLNREREERGEYQFANPRNAAAGAVRQLDPAEASRRRLSAWVYSSQHFERSTGSHHGDLQELTRFGLPVNPANRLVHSPEQAIEAYREILEGRNALDYEIDGVVFKVDSLAAQAAMGATGHEPRWAIAWKFPPEQVTTKLLSVSISHGRFGRLTPVANLEAVSVGGVTVQSASLHNEADMRRKDIREGDMVIIERAGDVIPQVVGPADTDPNRSTRRYTMPTNCPSCGAAVERAEGDAGHWCTNDRCPSLLPERLKHLTSKRAMNIEHMGDHWADAMIELGLVKDPADIYHLQHRDLLRLPRMGTRSADRLMKSIETSRDRPLDRVLYSLGIFRLGREVSGLMAQRCQSIEEAQAMQFHELAQIEGIGPKIATSVTEGMASPRVQAMIERMRSGGVRLEKDEPEPEIKERDQSLENQNFKGKTFVVTGKINGMTRDEVHSLIHQMGGSTASSVTKATSALISSDEPGKKPSTKMKKAMDLGIEIIGEKEFGELINA